MPESHHHHHHHSRSMSWAFVGGEKGHLSSKLKKRFPSNLKLHYNEVCDLSEKLSRRFFSRSHGSYHVQREYRNYGKINRPSDSWVTVHNLRQLDGGILDPDDRLHDVADDREQIIAIYDEATKPQQGDGTSASDESENHSPNIFKCTDHKFEPFSRNGIDITGEELNGTPSPLHVRRGSEPALNRLSPIPPYTNVPLDPSKRWSAAPVIEDQAPSSSTPLKDQVSISSPYEDTAFEGYPGERGEGSGEEKIPSSLSASSSASSHHSATTTTLSRFSRDGNRCSVQILSDNPNMARWAEAADRVIEAGGFFGKSEGMRREPLGGSSTPRHSREHSLEDNSRPSLLVCLKNDGTPLGIHVIPSTDRSGTEQGLLVEGIEPDGRVARDGRINVHDIIIEINDKPLRNVSFHQAQEIFKAAMVDPELRLLLSRRDNNRTSPVKMIQVKEKLASGSSRIANVTQTRKTPSITLSSRTQAVMLHSNTRKIGKRLTVNLIKGPHGLGFSITTRDNPAGGEAPIYIKNILPKGAAIDEGTLRIGDRLLEVNGVQVTGYSQSEVANLLRQIAVGGVAGLVVSRQEKIEDNLSGGIDYEEDFTNANPPSPKLPRQLPSERVLPEDSLMFPWRQREILTFEIPVHDSERAGLGVSVKGKTSSGPNGSVDLGIFVKNVIHGGAASRDGRLRQNDQLVNINGLSLLGKSNSEAMKTLRTAMHQEVPTPGKITLLVARRVEGSHRELRMMGTHASDNSGTSEASDNTVIFNNKKDMDIDRSVDGCLDYGNLDSFQMNNPVIQRLTGNGNMALRNESYYKATHDTWSATQMHPPLTPLSEKERITFVGGPLEKFSSPTVNPPSRDTVLIHDEYDSNLGGRRCSGQTVVPVSSSEGVYSEQQNKSNDAYNSLTSLDESGVGFSRDQFGRQSMSEKRHATLDAKNTDTYQRNKKAREEREKYRKELYAEMGIDGATRGLNKTSKEVGPGLGMRKSSSLESLQTMVQEMALEDECQRAGSGRVPRGRGCNESFRAAVDRSYDAPLSGANAQMETLTEEESESSGSGFGRGNSRQSSVSSSAEEKLKKGSKKRQGIFKGLGSMFRFGKHRKGLDHQLAEEGQMDLDNVDGHRLLSEKDDQNHQDLYKNSSDINDPLGNISGISPLDDENPSRSERMHQLRAEHQRRHVQRNGIYPTDDMEERYDHALKQRMDTMPVEPKAEIQHLRSRSYDFYGDGKDGRRQAKFPDPNKFSHYVNYEQIQMHLRKNKEQERLAKLASQQYQDFRDKQTSREQREYQSQRCARETSYQQRPVSNYFEYESVQAMMNHAQSNQHTSSLSRRPQQPLPHHQQRSNQHPPPPPPTQNSSSGNSQNSFSSGANKNANNPAPKTHTQGQGRIVHPQALFSHQRGQPTPPPTGSREGVYAASGFRPASQYNTANSYLPKPLNHHSLTVPGSKV